MNNNWNRNRGGRSRPWNRHNSNARGFGGRYPGYGPPRNQFFRRPSFNNEYPGNRKLRYGNFSNKKWTREQGMLTKRLTEEDISVTEFINDHEGFNGIIKSRFSDFQVSEINEAGEVAKLTTTSCPEMPVTESVDEDEDLLLNKYNLEILPMDTWDKINQLISSTGHPDEKIEIDVTGMTKEQRTKIHESVKKAFGDSIVGSTITIDDKKFVKFEKYRKGIRIDNRVKWMWPGEYVYFIMYKENCDTMEAATRVAERLTKQVKASMIGYAGTKDRRAKTSQWLSVRRVDPHRIIAAGAALAPIRLGNISFAQQPLKLGMLKGNRFRICLRNVTASDECVEAACSLLRERGFVNYYGLQRFGSRVEVPTYSIGLKLLQGNLKEAIDSILQERDGPIGDVLRVYSCAGPVAAERMISPALARANPVEARLLRVLALRPNDMLGALAHVPRNTRLLYLHALQSLVWNRAASERLRRSREALVGDLVPANTEPALIQENLEEDSDNEQDVEPSELESSTNHEEDNKTESEEKAETHKDKDGKDKKKYKREPKELIPVRVLTQDDIDSGKYTLFDVVLPLPGYKVQYPPNMKDYYEETLAKDGLKLDMKHKHKSFSLSGGYRALVVRPADVEWRTVRYSEPFCDLILSDADEMDGRTTTGEDENGNYKALLLSMNLPSSCYATMALRELLKADTSSVSQAQQNDYHNVKKKETESSKEENGEDTGEKRKAESDDVDSKRAKTE